MSKYLVTFVIGLAFGGLLVYSFVPAAGRFWQPTLEEISFNYLIEPIDLAIQSNQNLDEASVINNGVDTKKFIQKTAEQLMALKMYYVPLTEIPHLVYDADRLLHFGETELSQQNLQEAQQIVNKMMASGNQSLRAACEEIYLKMDDLLLSYNQSEKNINQKFRLLFHRLNLMLVKGELELSGDSFD